MSNNHDVAAASSPIPDDRSKSSSPLESKTKPSQSDTSLKHRVSCTAELELDTHCVVWARLPGYHLSEKSSRTVQNRTGWSWRWGFDIQEQKTGKKFWLCKICHVRKKNDVIFAAEGTQNQQKHIIQVHHHDKDGPVAVKRKRPTMLDKFGLDADKLSEQQALNRVVESFSAARFRDLLLAWVVHDGIEFRKLESKRLKAFHTAELVLSEFKKHLGVITELLASARSKIHVSFDLWTSHYCKRSMAGILVHFLDHSYQYRELLLSLPEHKGQHTGQQIGETIGDIFALYDLHGKTGYVMADNARNNDTAVEAPRREFGFLPEDRLRCFGHIINLVARQLLFGRDPDLMEQELQSLQEDDEQELAEWRKRGPLGRLHNVVIWINKSGQRMERFAEYQRSNWANDDDKQVLKLVCDNATRWNSFYDMVKRAVKLRAAIDEYADDVHLGWVKLAAKAVEKGLKDCPEPAISRDRLSPEDWEVVEQYLEYLSPLAAISVRLQGSASDARLGALWEVLPAMEYLLTRFEEFKSQVADMTAEDDPGHYRESVNLAWRKLDEYYQMTDGHPAYLAATTLHPAYRWRFADVMWEEKPTWIRKGRKAVEKMWRQRYKNRELPEDIEEEVIASQPRKERRKYDSDDHLDDYLRNTLCMKKRSLHGHPDELENWQATRDPADEDVENPLQYWINNRARWPHLAQMALDLFSVPAMSSGAEREFSKVRSILEDNRTRLRSEVVGALMCLRSWEEEGVIHIA